MLHPALAAPSLHRPWRPLRADLRRVVAAQGARVSIRELRTATATHAPTLRGPVDVDRFPIG